MKTISFADRCKVSSDVETLPKFVDEILVDAVDIVDGVVRKTSKASVVDSDLNNRGLHYRDFCADNLILIGQDPSSLPIINLRSDNLHIESDVLDKINSLSPDQLFDMSINVVDSNSQ